MSEITFSQAREFLDEISREDKIAIIHHDDGDGFCSGILFYDWCKNKNAMVKEFTYSIHKSKLKNFDLAEFNKVIVCDLASGFMAEELELIKDKRILYLDHHPRDVSLPKEVLEFSTVDNGYIPSSRTAGELTRIKPWLALVGTITDAGDLYPENQDFISEHLKQTRMGLDKFKEDITSTITNFLIYFEGDFDKAFEILQKVNSIGEVSQLKKYSEAIEDEIEKFIGEYEDKKEKIGDVNFYYFKPHFSIKAPVTGIISQKNHEEIYIFATPKKDGKHLTLSARNTSQKENMANLLRAGVSGLEDGSAGGHPAASGGMILAEDLGKFKRNIKQFVEPHS